MGVNMKVKFLYGTPRREPTDLYGREEILAIHKLIADRLQPYALIGPRRVGKTSILHALNSMLRKRGLLTAYIDAERGLSEGALTLQTFTRLYSFSILEDYMTQAGMRERLRVLLRESTSRVISSLGRLLGRIEKASLKLETKPLTAMLEVHLRAETGEISFKRALEHSLDFPQELAKRNKRKIVIFIDEFQFISDLKVATPGILHVMRSHFQEHDSVAYVISGSSVGMLTRLIGDRQEPFYGFFLAQEVKPFNTQTATDFLQEGLRSEKVQADASAVNHVIAHIDGIPAWLNYVGAEAVRLLKARDSKKFTKEIAEEITTKLRADPLVTKTLEAEYKKLERLSPRLVAVYRILSREEGGLRPVEIKQQLEREFRRQTPFSRVSDSLRRLVELGFTVKSGETYQVVDPVLSAYAALRKNSSGVAEI